MESADKVLLVNYSKLIHHCSPALYMPIFFVQIVLISLSQGASVATNALKQRTDVGHV